MINLKIGPAATIPRTFQLKKKQVTQFLFFFFVLTHIFALIIIIKIADHTHFSALNIQGAREVPNHFWDTPNFCPFIVCTVIWKVLATEQRINVLSWRLNGLSFAEVQGMFRRSYRTEAPTRTTIRGLDNKFQRTGNVCDEKRSEHSSTSQETVETIWQAIEQSPKATTSSSQSGTRNPKVHSMTNLTLRTEEKGVSHPSAGPHPTVHLYIPGGRTETPPCFKEIIRRGIYTCSRVLWFRKPRRDHSSVRFKCSLLVCWVSFHSWGTVQISVFLSAILSWKNLRGESVVVNFPILLCRIRQRYTDL